MQRRTKIVTTLGPSIDNKESIAELLLAGANVVRMNFSHGSSEDHLRRAKLVREVSHELGLHVAILGDLQGPKIRIAKFKNNVITLQPQQPFVLDNKLPQNEGNENRVGIDYKNLPQDCKKGDQLLLDDGRIALEVTEISEHEIMTQVLVGGELSNNKGINLKGGGLSAPALTEKDKQDILTAVEMDVDYLAISFPRHAQDILEAKTLLNQAGGKAGIVAKIERAEIVQSSKILDEVIQASEAVMVARGDLGVEIGDAELIGVQKRIISRARALDKIVITATQMMESMITSPIPTRAEVFDVANAVLDGTDAVMLSAETATGSHPVLVVEAMSRVCLGAEKEKSALVSSHRMNIEFKRMDESIAMSTMYIANHLKGIKAIISLTESGSTALWMSRISSGIPIYALTRREDTQRRVALYRGVEAIQFDPTQLARNEVNKLAVEALYKRGLVNNDDLVILTKGDHMGLDGGTNAMKILKVGHII